MKKAELSALETLFYYVYVLCTFGGIWILKIVIKKAIIESK
jgi:hypothetical protein